MPPTGPAGSRDLRVLPAHSECMPRQGRAGPSGSLSSHLSWTSPCSASTPIKDLSYYIQRLGSHIPRPEPTPNQSPGLRSLGDPWLTASQPWAPVSDGLPGAPALAGLCSVVFAREHGLRGPCCRGVGEAAWAGEWLCTLSCDVAHTEVWVLRIPHTGWTLLVVRAKGVHGC